MGKREKIVELIEKFNCKVRIRYKNEKFSSWNNYILFPEKNYIEVDYPLSINEILGIEINTINKKDIGKLIPEEIENNFEKFALELMKFGIDYNNDKTIISISRDELLD
jgi:hypothetical protein